MLAKAIAESVSNLIILYTLALPEYFPEPMGSLSFSHGIACVFLFLFFFFFCDVSRHPLPQSLASDYVGPALRYASCMCYLFSSIHELRLERERERVENSGFGHSRWNCGNDSHFSRSSIIQESFPQRQSAATCMNYLYKESSLPTPAAVNVFRSFVVVVCFLFLRRERESPTF